MGTTNIAKRRAASDAILKAATTPANDAQYHRVFARLARRALPQKQYEGLHVQARATAGGYARHRVAQEAAAENGRRVRSERLVKALCPAPRSDVLAVVAAALSHRAPAQEASVAAAVEHHHLVPVRKAADQAMPIVDAAQEKQIVYCVALEPGVVDLQGDVVSARDIELAAHQFVTKSGVIGAMHERTIDAAAVESYIAPQDLTFNGVFGKQVVKRGSWVLGIHVADPNEWARVKSGEYTGISIGGTGLRIPIDEKTIQDD